jgi:hypothetical protein
VYSLGAGENIENSSIPTQTPGLLAASLSGIQRRYDQSHVSPEVYLATQVGVTAHGSTMLGLVRGVTSRAPLVRRRVRLTEGRWPESGEVIAGRLAHAKLGCAPEALFVGNTVNFEGVQWRVSGRFTARGAAFESEFWCPLDDLQQAMKRQDLSLVALSVKPGASPAEVDLFCKERVDLELQAVTEPAYYATLRRHFRPVRTVAWLVVVLVAGAGTFAGLNTMYGAVVGRTRELAMLQATGFRRRAIVASLVQEGTLLAAAASLLAGAIALALVEGSDVRFSMGAFSLRVDSTTVLIGCGTGLLVGVAGTIPPAIRAMRQSVAESLKAM